MTSGLMPVASWKAAAASRRPQQRSSPAAAALERDQVLDDGANAHLISAHRSTWPRSARRQRVGPRPAGTVLDADDHRRPLGGRDHAVEIEAGAVEADVGRELDEDGLDRSGGQRAVGSDPDRRPRGRRRRRWRRRRRADGAAGGHGWASVTVGAAEQYDASEVVESRRRGRGCRAPLPSPAPCGPRSRGARGWRGCRDRYHLDVRLGQVHVRRERSDEGSLVRLYKRGRAHREAIEIVAAPGGDGGTFGAGDGAGGIGGIDGGREFARGVGDVGPSCS